MKSKCCGAEATHCRGETMRSTMPCGRFYECEECSQACEVTLDNGESIYTEEFERHLEEKEATNETNYE